jgi:hypothetical protein
LTRSRNYHYGHHLPPAGTVAVSRAPGSLDGLNSHLPCHPQAPAKGQHKRLQLFARGNFLLDHKREKNVASRPEHSNRLGKHSPQTPTPADPAATGTGAPRTAPWDARGIMRKKVPVHV